MTPRVEWRGRSDFAEVAEALGIATEDVMAVTGAAQGGVHVVYTLGTGDLATVHVARLARGSDRVYRKQFEATIGSLRQWAEEHGLTDLFDA